MSPFAVILSEAKDLLLHRSVQGLRARVKRWIPASGGMTVLFHIAGELKARDIFTQQASRGVFFRGRLDPDPES